MLKWETSLLLVRDWHLSQCWFSHLLFILRQYFHIFLLKTNNNMFFYSIFSFLYCCAALLYTVLHADAGWHCRNADVCVMFHIPWASGEVAESPCMGSYSCRYFYQEFGMLDHPFKMYIFHRFLWDYSCHHIWSSGWFSWLDARLWAQLLVMVIWSGSCWHIWPLSVCHPLLYWSKSSSQETKRHNITGNFFPWTQSLKCIIIHVFLSHCDIFFNVFRPLHPSNAVEQISIAILTLELNETLKSQCNFYNCKLLESISLTR